MELVKNKNKINEEKEEEKFSIKIRRKVYFIPKKEKRKKKFRLGPWAIQAQPRVTNTITPMI